MSGDGATKRLHLGLNAPGFQRSAWRRDGVDPLGPANAEYYVRLAQEAERGLFDAFFLNDQPTLHPGWETSPQARLDPLIALASVAQHTERIGLVATVSTSWNHPYNLARAIGSLDRASHGRAGWNVVTSYNPLIAANFGLDVLPPKEVRYARAGEFVDVVRQLWQTWAPDAIVADRRTGQWADPEKVRLVRHRGEHFSATGGSTVPSSEQGLPVIFQAGASDAGLALAGRQADATFVAATTVEAALAYRHRLDAASVVREKGRARVLALPGATLVLASTDEEAERRWAESMEVDGAAASLAQLATRLGLPVGRLELDAPVPLDEIDLEARRRQDSEGFVDSMVTAARTGRTVREILRGGAGHLQIVGSPRTVAELFATWFASGAVDGFNLMFDVIEEGLPLFVDEVVPLLQERGLFRRKYDGSTLRDHLGLPIPRW
jgi:FMN-dependent oxidoreductase (nitrilotriacetate monooxygenase family)